MASGAARPAFDTAQQPQPAVASMPRPAAGVATPPPDLAPPSTTGAATPAAASIDVRVRLVLVPLVLVMSGFSHTLLATTGWLALALLVVALPHLPGTRGRTTPAVRIGLEVAVVCVGALTTGLDDTALMAYLPASVFAAGLIFRSAGAALSAALATALLVVTPLVLGPELPPAPVVEWLLLALALGMFAAFSQQIADGPRLVSSRQGYAHAHRLLAQLRSLTRHLPGALDSQIVVDSLLEACRSASATEHAAVFSAGPDGVLIPRAVHGMSRVPWREPTASSSPLWSVLHTRRPVLDVRAPDAAGGRAGSSLLLCPMLVEDVVVGVVALESCRLDAFTPAVIAAVTREAEDSAVKLEAALLFEELVASSTLEARELLAQGMHDGVAQDLASFGYQIDCVRADLRSAHPETAVRLGELRSALTQLLTDIRLSITDLRTGVDPNRGLATVLTSYVRSAGTGSDLVVHVSLQESGFRLPATTEIELFKIAQEAIQPVRRHRGAGNLWVSLLVDPPAAVLRIEHDLAAGAHGPLWCDTQLALARQRAERLGAVLESESTEGRHVLQVRLRAGS